MDLTVRLSFMLKVVSSGERHFTHLGEGREATNTLLVEHFDGNADRNKRINAFLFILSGVFYLLAPYPGNSYKTNNDSLGMRLSACKNNQ